MRVVNGDHAVVFFAPRGPSTRREEEGSKKMITKRLTGLLGCAFALAAGAAQAAPYTCSAVAIRGNLDPDGFAFTNKFYPPVAVNTDGDVAFVGRARTQQQALYKYEDGGPNSVIARIGQPAPGGSSFMRFGSTAFGNVSMNTAGNVAFISRLSLPGEGIFVLDGGTLEKAVQTTDAAPGGGAFLSFPSVSQLDDSETVFFVANVDGAPSGIFSYDAGANSIDGPFLTTADVDDGGNPFCAFQRIGSSNGAVAFVATVGIPDCGTPVQSLSQLVTVGVSLTVARAGDASPIGGTTFDTFLDSPETSASAITFAARVTGNTYTGDGLFSWSGAFTKLAAVGDAAPDVGGSLKKLGSQHQQTLANDVYALFYTRGTPASHGIFVFNGSGSAAQVKTDVPPAPPFGVGARYRAIAAPAVDKDGAFLAFSARVKDTVAPSSKSGILRCAP